MATRNRLSDDERGFFDRLARFCYSNPFSAESATLLAELLPGSQGRTSEDDPHALSRLTSERLAPHEHSAPARLDDFEERDRTSLEAAFFYLAYHRFMEELDTLIITQLRASEPVHVPFHDRYFAEMLGRGFSEDAAALQLGFFYQLRRTFYFIIKSLPGKSRAMRALCSSLWNNVFTHDMRIYASRAWRNMEDFSTLLLGETGTGKGSAAATIGRSGFIPYDIGRQRFKANFMQSFVTLNLCQFPETLLESELFGHQVKLLQVLQERTFTPLGQHTPVRFAGRVIAATNRTIAELHGERGFRDDFFYRLCSDVITVPTLRERISERPDEFDELVAVIIERIFGAADAPLAVQTTLALRRDLPTDYVWPGNVRELEQAVRRVLLTGSYRGRAPLASRDREDAYLSAVEAGALPADELVGRYCAMLYARSPVYAGVAQATQLDRRTVRKHVLRYS